MQWAATFAGETAEVACASKYPSKSGVISRACSLQGTWGEPSEACAEAGMFAYETERVVRVRGEEMTPVMPKLEGSAVFSEVDCGRGARG